MSSLATTLQNRALIGIEIAQIDRQNSLQQLQIAAQEVQLPIQCWSSIATGWHSLDRILHEWDVDFDLGGEVLRHLAFDSLPSGICVYIDLFATIDALEAPKKVRAHQAIINLFFHLQKCADRRVVFLETGEIPSRYTQAIYGYDFPLPTPTEVRAAIAIVGLPPDNPKFLNILSGLTAEEIQLALKPISPGMDLDRAAEVLLDYKYELFATYGLEFIGETATKDIGGLDRVKTALDGVIKSFTPEARNYNIPIPRGWLMVGIPGVGKTYFAKICAQKLGFPLINIGIDVAKSGGVNKFKRLLDRIDACEPCLPYFDEFDKFFMGDNAGEFLGVILTWLNEKTSKTFVLATLNRLENLPPELTRAGRFDRTFYVDFPRPAERKEILQLHLARFDSAYKIGHGRLTDREWFSILERTDKCTGAELAQIAIEAATDQFYRLEVGGAIEIFVEDILAARKCVKTLYSRNPEGIMAIENRAKSFTEPASSDDIPHPFDLPNKPLYSLNIK
jgi:SpoVK/Ycf46/Vps4 family AAA+-type ATPase